MPIVTLAACPDYRRESIEAALERMIAALGGWQALIQPGMRVLVKPNLLMRASPERAVTTHPELVAAVCRAVVARGAKPVIADSPGGPHSQAWLQGVYNGCGMARVAQETGAELYRDSREEVLAITNGRAIKKTAVIAPAVEADCIINLAKLKTHGLTTYTGACKNLFGLVPGLAKAEYHSRFPEITDFAAMLVDIAEGARPVLNIIDAVLGMDGDGPSHGRPREIGVLIASSSPHAADLLGARLFGLTPERTPTLLEAQKRGLLEDIEVAGDDATPFIMPDAVIPGTPEASVRLGGSGFFARAGARALRAKPRLIAERCVGCGVCAQSCPRKIIEMKNGKPGIGKGCIRCLCCAELCPKDAMIARKSLLLRMVR